MAKREFEVTVTRTGSQNEREQATGKRFAFFFHLTVLSAVDEYERARTRLRSLIGKRAKEKDGKLTHSPGLYGYEFDKETDTLHIIEEEAKIIRLMYQWFITQEDMTWRRRKWNG